MIPVKNLIALVMLSSFTIVSHARDESDLSIKLVQGKIVTLQGKETRESADSVKPGDTIEYTAEYFNKGSKPITSLYAIIPVPSDVEYLPASARPAIIQASLNGDKYESVPLKRKVKHADGKEIEELVPYREYRYVRWAAGDLAPGNSQKYSLRVRLDTNEPAVSNKPEK